MVSRGLSRLRTRHVIMLCGKELVNACMRTEMRLLCIYRLKASHFTQVWCDQFLWTQQKSKDVIYNSGQKSINCSLKSWLIIVRESQGKKWNRVPHAKKTSSGRFEEQIFPRIMQYLPDQLSVPQPVTCCFEMALHFALKCFLRFQAVRLQAVIIICTYMPPGVVIFPLSVF